MTLIDEHTSDIYAWANTWDQCHAIDIWNTFTRWHTCKKQQVIWISCNINIVSIKWTKQQFWDIQLNSLWGHSRYLSFWSNNWNVRANYTQRPIAQSKQVYREVNYDFTNNKPSSLNLIITNWMNMHYFDPHN